MVVVLTCDLTEHVYEPDEPSKMHLFEKADRLPNRWGDGSPRLRAIGGRHRLAAMMMPSEAHRTVQTRTFLWHLHNTCSTDSDDVDIRKHMVLLQARASTVDTSSSPATSDTQHD